MSKPERRIADNKKAYYDYFVDETFEAGIVLTGTEVKALRESRGTLKDTYAIVRKSEVWLLGMHISPYSHGNRANADPNRQRKLLLHKTEIRYLIGKTKERGYALVPLRMYFSDGNKVKLELGLARGKKNYDKRDDLAKKDQARDVARALRDRQKG